MKIRLKKNLHGLVSPKTTPANFYKILPAKNICSAFKILKGETAGNLPPFHP